MPPLRTLRVALDAANIDEVRKALSAGTSLVLAVKALEDVVPGKANPVLLDRRVIDELFAATDAYVAAVGEVREAQVEDAPAE